MPTSVMPESGRPAPEEPPPARSRMTPRSMLLWAAVALIGAIGWGVLALARGEEISAVWLVVAALGSYAIAYRFYSRFVARRVLKPDDRRATPQNAWRTESTSSRPTAGYCSAITSRRSPAPGRWWGRCSRPRWGICRAPCGSSPE